MDAERTDRWSLFVRSLIRLFQQSDVMIVVERASVIMWANMKIVDWEENEES